MKDLVLYCKSYSRDFLRLRRLLDSVRKFNVDQLDFYISTPKSEKALLVEVLGEKGYVWVADEDIVALNPKVDFSKYQEMSGGLSQQIIKSEFWRLGFSENYLCLDSDSFFIHNFYKSDFLSNDGVPYTVLHQNKEFFQLATDRGYRNVEENLKNEAERVKTLFNRSGPNFYCAPSPFIWSARVWSSLDVQYLQPKGMTLWDLVDSAHPETLIYSEALLKYHAIPLIAIEPLFRTYHYDWQYFLMRRLGETEEKIRSNYLGVIYQSNWNRNLAYASQKSFASIALGWTKRLLRRIESYF